MLINGLVDYRYRPTGKLIKPFFNFVCRLWLLTATFYKPISIPFYARNTVHSYQCRHADTVAFCILLQVVIYLRWDFQIKSSVVKHKISPLCNLRLVTIPLLMHGLTQIRLTVAPRRFNTIVMNQVAQFLMIVEL